MGKYKLDNDLNFVWGIETSMKLDSVNELEDQDRSWRSFLSKNTPMGKLLNTNTLFDSVTNEIGRAHV